MKGFVYVMSNKAMPGLVKIGYSTKHPELRAEELDGTGLPHKFIVEYCAFVDTPDAFEQKIHNRLTRHREAKEFFRLTVEKAIAHILEIADDNRVLLLYQEGDLYSREAAARDRIERERFYELLDTERRLLFLTERDALESLLDLAWCYFDSSSKEPLASFPDSDRRVPDFDETWFSAAINSAPTQSLRKVAFYDWIVNLIEKISTMPNWQEAKAWAEEIEAAIERSKPSIDDSGSRFARDYECGIMANYVPTASQIKDGQIRAEKDDLHRALRMHLDLPKWKWHRFPWNLFDSDEEYKPDPIERIRTFLGIESELQKYLKATSGPRTSWLDLVKTNLGRAIQRRCRTSIAFSFVISEKDNCGSWVMTEKDSSSNDPKGS